MPNQFKKPKKVKTPEVMITHNNDNGKNTFHPNRINWSYLYRGRVALTHKKINNNDIVFRANQINSGIKLKGVKSKGGNHPPKNKIVPIPLIKIMAAYSPRKNRANKTEEYSVK